MTSPPTVLTNGTMTAVEGCASAADAAGNLLLYTDGATIWDQTHAVMANGSGLFGNSASGQAALIIKQPGSAILYYVITQGAGSGGLNYSIVNISLSAGNGSVTVKNNTLAPLSQCTEKLTGTKHCNGTDFWIVTHDLNSSVFRAYLLSSTGLSAVPVLSTVGSSYTGSSGLQGWMKISQNGKKLGAAMFNIGSPCELFDFNNTTGVVSNSVSLPVGLESAYGVEFSGDGSKFYSSTGGIIYQWNLCAGTATAIVASQVAISAAPVYGMQLAINGKIYVARNGQASVGVINNPNVAGTGCNYTNVGQTVGPKTSNVSMVNFVSGFLNQHMTPPPFTYIYNNTTGCQTASFTASPNPTLYCPAAGYSITNLAWNFGDPGSGAANTTTVTNPTHLYTTTGTHTVQLIMYYSCGGGSDTLRQPVSIIGPTLSLSTSSVSCASLGSATVTATGGIGPYTYTWNPSAQTNSVATGLTPGTYSITVLDNGINCAFTSTTNFAPPFPMTGTVAQTFSFSCFGANTGTATVVNLAGGSGNQTYSWTGVASLQTGSMAIALSAGSYTVLVTDALTNCTFRQTFQITQPPALTVTVGAASPSACVGTSVVLTATASGGTPAYTYTWVGGQTTSSQTVSQLSGGNYIYSLTTKDANNCGSTKTVSVQFVNRPVLTLTSVSICPLAFGTLSVSGAASYTWNNLSTGSTLNDNPLVSTSYSAIGSAAGCTSAATASIILNTVPSVTLSANTPLCSGQSLVLNASAGQSYLWSGPGGFTSSVQNPNINPSSSVNSGNYGLVLTAANGCTTSVSTSVVINPSPPLTATGSSVCALQAITLNALSTPGGTFIWTGPAFSSLLQSPSIASGNYTIKVTSAVGCTNSAMVNVSVTAMPSVLISGDSQRCVGDVLHLSGSGGTSYAWLGPNLFNTTVQSPTLGNVGMAASGVYTLTITKGPCVTSGTTALVVYSLPTISATNNGPACQNKQLSLSAASNGVSFVWVGPSAYLKFSQNTPPIDSVNLYHAGIYTVTTTDIHSCQASATTTVVILPNPALTAQSTTVCLFDTATLTVNGANTYQWYGPGNFYSQSANAIINNVTNLVPLTYTAIGFASNTCSSSIKVSISTLSLPSPSLSVQPQTPVCANKKIQLQGFGASYYDWVGPNNVTFSGQTVTFVASNNAYTGTYTLFGVDAKGCRGQATTVLLIDPLPVGGLDISKPEACVPFRSDFNFYSNAAAQIKSVWELQGKRYDTTTFSANFISPGTYTIKGFLTNTLTSCANTVSMTVKAYPVPVADYTYSPAIPVENSDAVTFSATSKGDKISSFEWSFIENGGTHSSNSKTFYYFEDAGLYPLALVVKNVWGCSDTIVKVIKVNYDFTIFVPNIFTPNADGMNDVFIPVTRGIKFYSLMLFDRWGEKIFESSDPSLGWDGTQKGVACTNDIYLWKLSVSGNNGEAKEMQGHVTLSR